MTNSDTVFKVVHLHVFVNALAYSTRCSPHTATSPSRDSCIHGLDLLEISLVKQVPACDTDQAPQLDMLNSTR